MKSWNPYVSRGTGEGQDPGDLSPTDASLRVTGSREAASPRLCSWTHPYGSQGTEKLQVRDSASGTHRYGSRGTEELKSGTFCDSTHPYGSQGTEKLKSKTLWLTHPFAVTVVFGYASVLPRSNQNPFSTRTLVLFIIRLRIKSQFWSGASLCQQIPPLIRIPSNR